jgi:hypothetical protein
MLTQARIVLVTAMAGLAADAPLAAHHYFASTFDATQTVRLTGILTRIEWTNPHSHFYIDVVDGEGVTSWTCEGGSPGALSRRGLGRTDIKPGDTLVIDGYRARDGSRFVIARRLTLASGKVISGALADGRAAR